MREVAWGEEKYHSTLKTYLNMAYNLKRTLQFQKKKKKPTCDDGNVQSTNKALEFGNSMVYVYLFMKTMEIINYNHQHHHFLTIVFISIVINKGAGIWSRKSTAHTHFPKSHFRFWFYSLIN